MNKDHPEYVDSTNSFIKPHEIYIKTEQEDLCLNESNTNNTTFLANYNLAEGLAIKSEKTEPMICYELGIQEDACIKQENDFSLPSHFGIETKDLSINNSQPMRKDTLFSCEETELSLSDEIVVKAEPVEDISFMDQKSTNVEVYYNSGFKNESHDNNHNPESKITISHHTNPEGIFKCDSCNYKTKQRRHFNTHQIVHMDPSQVIFFKCTECGYKTKYEHNLKKHRLVHSDSNKIKCDKCNFKTTRPRSFKKHEIIHQAAPFKCEKCDFSTKHRKCLNTHQLVHMDPSEVVLFKCIECSYETKYRQNIKKHTLVHLESRFIRCDKCEFKTKSGKSLKKHELVHSDSGQVKCDKCEFKTKSSRGLKAHEIIHLKEFAVLKCHECDFSTRYPRSLKRHRFIHLVTIFRCERCDFKTKRMEKLEKHVVVHTNPEQLKKFKCDDCEFKTKLLGNLKRHKKIHMVVDDSVSSFI